MKNPKEERKEKKKPRQEIIITTNRINKRLKRETAERRWTEFYMKMFRALDFGLSVRRRPAGTFSYSTQESLRL